MTNDPVDVEMVLGMYKWEPGTLSTRVLERILLDALSDLWADCYRRDAPGHQQFHLFREKLMELIRCATDHPMQVVKS